MWLVALSALLFPLMAWADSVSLDQKIGQLLIVGFSGYEVKEEDPIARQIAEGKVGGVILFDYDGIRKEFGRNIQSPAQLQALCSKLQKLAPTPLLISIDQEGGVVNRLKSEYGFPQTASAQSLGEKQDLKATLEQGEQTGSVLADMGISLNFAPVVDLNLLPANPIGRRGRSFSSDPDVVTAQAREIIHGHHRHGVLTTLKHFPGHGSSTADTHEGFADITETWSEGELKPYQALLASGDVDLIMIGHVFNGKLDPDHPASLSRLIVTDLLRNKLKFDGVVVTDDLQMKAIANHYSLEDTVRLSLQAGCDLLLFCQQETLDPEIVPKVIAIVKQLIASGELSEEQINRSYERVQALKRTFPKDRAQ